MSKRVVIVVKNAYVKKALAYLEHVASEHEEPNLRHDGNVKDADAYAYVSACIKKALEKKS